MGASSAPPFPYPGGTVGVEPPDPVAGQGGHFAWSNWIKQFTKNLDAQTVKRSGDTILGDLTVDGDLFLTDPGMLSAAVRLTKEEYLGEPVLGVNAGAPGSGLPRPAVAVGAPVHADHAVTLAFMQAALASASPAGVPIGGIIMFGSGIPPTGWLLCNGQATTGYPALIAAVGGFVPDLRDLFIMGAGGSHAVGTTGGAASVTLTANQSGLPAHTHTATSAAETQNHTHGVGTLVTGSSGAHTHPSPIGFNYALVPAGGDPIGARGSGGYNWVSGYGSTIPSAGAHTHTLTGSTSGKSATHTHGITVSSVAAANAAAPHENRPPFYALTFIIRAQ